MQGWQLRLPALLCFCGTDLRAQPQAFADRWFRCFSSCNSDSRV